MTANGDTLEQLFMKCGYGWPVSVTLGYLVRSGSGNPVTVKQIQGGTGLAQPPVSMALQKLIHRGWVQTGLLERPAGALGPNMKTFTLIPLEKVYEGIQKEQGGKVKEIDRILGELFSAMIPSKTGMDEHVVADAAPAEFTSDNMSYIKHPEMQGQEDIHH